MLLSQPHLVHCLRLSFWVPSTCLFLRHLVDDCKVASHIFTYGPISLHVSFIKSVLLNRPNILAKSVARKGAFNSHFNCNDVKDFLHIYIFFSILFPFAPFQAISTV